MTPRMLFECQDSKLHLHVHKVNHHDSHYLEDLHDMEAFKKAIRVVQKTGKAFPVHHKGIKFAAAVN